MALLVYVMITVPLELGYGVGAGDYIDLFSWNVVVDHAFMIDVLLNFRTGFQGGTSHARRT